MNQETDDSLPVEIRKRFKLDISFYAKENACPKCGRMQLNCVCAMKDERLYKW